MNSADEIKRKVHAFLDEACSLDPSTIQDDVPLFSSGVLSSIDLVDLVSFLDSDFGIQMGALDIDFNNFDTVDKITAFIQSNVRK